MFLLPNHLSYMGSVWEQVKCFCFCFCFPVWGLAFTKVVLYKMCVCVSM